LYSPSKCILLLRCHTYYDVMVNGMLAEIIISQLGAEAWEPSPVYKKAATIGRGDALWTASSSEHYV